jgi:hypothetical protein
MLQYDANSLIKCDDPNMRNNHQPPPFPPPRLESEAYELEMLGERDRKIRLLAILGGLLVAILLLILWLLITSLGTSGAHGTGGAHSTESSHGRGNRSGAQADAGGGMQEAVSSATSNSGPAEDSATDLERTASASTTIKVPLDEPTQEAKDNHPIASQATLDRHAFKTFDFNQLQAVPGAGSSTRSAGNGTGDDEPTFFGVPTLELRTVFLVDRSFSMAGDNFQAACRELVQCIERLEPTQQVLVVLFDESALVQFAPKPLPKLLPASPANKDRLRSWIGEQDIGGGTDPSDALAIAFSAKPDTIVILSDGEFHTGIVDAVKRANVKLQARVNTIALGSEARTLKAIAEQNDGIYRVVP